MTRIHLILLLAILACALSTVTAASRARQLFWQLDDLQRRSRLLDGEWGKMQLEISAWSTPARVSKLAREQLHMAAPEKVFRPTERFAAP